MIEHYFKSVLLRLRTSPYVRAHQLGFDARGPSTGFIRGVVTFADESQLHVRELVETQPVFERVAYAYHYQEASARLIFRYDNTPHFPDLPTHPHHKHAGMEESVIASSAPTLIDVLDEIELLPRWVS